MRRYSTMNAKAPSTVAAPGSMAVAALSTTPAPRQPHTSTKPALGPRAPRAPRTQQLAAAALPRTPHPDAAVRDAERELRKLERMRLIQVEKTAIWWESEHASNVSLAQTESELARHKASAKHPNSRPLVMSFFTPTCPGCRRMFPKFMQIARDHPHFDFVKVNTEPLKESCEKLGVKRSPFFKIWGPDGECTHSFTCNLQNINELRRALYDATQTSPRRTIFRSPYITEMPLSSPLSPAIAGAAADASPPAAAAAAAAASASTPAGSFRERTEHMHTSSRGSDGGPAGAVGGSGSWMPSINDLVNIRICDEESFSDCEDTSEVIPISIQPPATFPGEKLPDPSTVLPPLHGNSDNAVVP